MSSNVVEYTPDQVSLIKDTCCRDASDLELKFFLNQVQRTQLDPLSKQIYAIKRYDTALRREVLGIQVGIDGLRLIAERTGETDGQDGPYWCGEDGKWVDVWLSNKPPSAAKAVVYRKGRTHAYVGIARWTSYCQLTKDGSPTRMWQKMSDLMLYKCAEALALRKAFPHELSGIYTDDEMDQAIPVVEESPAISHTKTSAIPHKHTPAQIAHAPGIRKDQMDRLAVLIRHLGAKPVQDLMIQTYEKSKRAELTENEARGLISALEKWNLAEPAPEPIPEQPVPVVLAKKFEITVNDSWTFDPTQPPDDDGQLINTGAMRIVSNLMKQAKTEVGYNFTKEVCELQFNVGSLTELTLYQSWILIHDLTSRLDGTGQEQEQEAAV